MSVLSEFDGAANELRQLLAVLTPLQGQEKPPAITPEWMQQAQAALQRANALCAHSSFHTAKPSPQVQHYRQELVRLKEAVEQGQRQLTARRSVIQAEQRRLKCVQSLTGTLEALT